MLGSTLLSAAVCLAAAAPSPPPPPKLDKRAIERFAERWFEARPPTRFADWDEARRAELLDEAAQVAVPEGALEDVVELLWKAARKHGPRTRNDEFETPFGKASWLQSGRGKGKGLVLGLHGGGEGAGSASEATRWVAKGCIGIYPQGIRLVHDTWNTVHGERFLLTLIELAKLRHEIDPDRVYSMGFSMGGTGSWFLAGRHPDLLAGSRPCAGVLMAQPKSQLETKEEVEALQHGFVPNVRNLAMDYFIGLEDRNCMPGTYLYVWDRILELRAEDPGGYRDIRFDVIPGLAHAFPPGEPTAGIARVIEHRRNAFPDKLVWEYVSDPYPLPAPDAPVGRLPKHHFYWLHCDRPVDRMRVVAERDGNEFDVTVERVAPGALSILLRPGVFDPGREVVVRVNGEETWRGRPSPSFRTIVESFDAKLDRTLVFDRAAPLVAD
ncbi:MAG: hypothetical protein ACF8XB_15360 [Planctomycetota bacterium JB042]